MTRTKTDQNGHLKGTKRGIMQELTWKSNKTSLQVSVMFPVMSLFVHLFYMYMEKSKRDDEKGTCHVCRPAVRLRLFFGRRHINML